MVINNMLDDRKIYDFSDCSLGRSTYQGANGAKISILIDGTEYMLKFPSLAKRNPYLHYSNGIISEYVGSHIFSILGMDS